MKPIVVAACELSAESSEMNRLISGNLLMGTLCGSLCGSAEFEMAFKRWQGVLDIEKDVIEGGVRTFASSFNPLDRFAAGVKQLFVKG